MRTVSLLFEQELAEKQTRLAESENAELALRKERRQLEEEKQRLELEVERRLQAERLRIREATQKEEEQSYLLKLAEKEKIISDMKKQVEELRRKSEQSSQQLQGEVLELELEAMLRAAFPADLIEPGPKGRNGGDVVHRVVGPNGLQCGTILWESKRTRSWSDTWLAKNREDVRLAGANVGAVVTTAMPKGIETFDRLENVWVAAMRCALPLAKALRHALIEAAMAKVVTQGKDGKMERLYEYLIGPSLSQSRFSHRRGLRLYAGRSRSGEACLDETLGEARAPPGTADERDRGDVRRSPGSRRTLHARTARAADPPTGRQHGPGHAGRVGGGPGLARCLAGWCPEGCHPPNNLRSAHT